MNERALWTILEATTQQFRKGPPVVMSDHVTEVFDMPHKDDASPALLSVDMEFLCVGVDLVAAATHRAALIELLDEHADEFEIGPSYIRTGALIGDQGMALRLFALGQALGLWKVITPHMLGLEGEEARRAAGAGYVMINGYEPS